MLLTVHVWRQPDAETQGGFETVSPVQAREEMSILELLDAVNETLERQGDEPVSFDDGCREGICGKCGVTVDGVPHGPDRNRASCMQSLNAYRDGDEVFIEPMRAGALPVKKDLAVDKKSLRRVSKEAKFPVAMKALNTAGCISCGACIAACPNGSGQLFVGTMLKHLPPLAKTPEERDERAAKVLDAADQEFGPCSLLGDCTEVCPAGLPLQNLTSVTRENLHRKFPERYPAPQGPDDDEGSAGAEKK
ncbi:succinate dehydrogenase/fumarate reductase iron-sulfur subunit [Glutamicibacter protophormiae]|uniref:succinate dehydrogenase/fumarate reductase iron-sulfur subunit n=1 Tax=unclassified Kocuria TaxID=2649579 RepID=UPI000F879CF2|nr:MULTISPECIES: succinate dehydrogenase/fumarate reductase iron-sulfur subunit [unclassified Kocuria]RUP85060.1 succinate dehydrogenase/fumarate reductase iron-sulfur subunit [Kocuria sp. HSID17590]RUQ09285.1 succinate dehydrogenase/fumarate reductase iron-sulfur subunit [Kocuria sp. HSID17582]WNB88746.1 succinate dehydrogenase/fumarate reductase iron-sulfur subunit [Glutamicibacter protophormiae]